MKKLFLKLKPSAVLLLLKDTDKSWYPSNLARAAGASYVHTVNLLAHLRQNGIVETATKGRQHIYKLTEKGAYLAAALDDFARKCETYGQEARAQAKQETQQGQPAAEEEKKAEAEKK